MVEWTEDEEEQDEPWYNYVDAAVPWCSTCSAAITPEFELLAPLEVCEEGTVYLLGCSRCLTFPED